MYILILYYFTYHIIHSSPNNNHILCTLNPLIQNIGYDDKRYRNKYM